MKNLTNWLRNNVEISFSRSSGPGGQNVNKVSTKVTLRLDLSTLDFLDEEAMERIREHGKRYLTKDDALVVQAEEGRSQGRNRDLAYRKLEAIVRTAMKQRKRRKKTSPSAAVKERRLQNKKRRGRKKEFRKKPDISE